MIATNPESISARIELRSFNLSQKVDDEELKIF